MRDIDALVEHELLGLDHVDRVLVLPVLAVEGEVGDLTRQGRHRFSGLGHRHFKLVKIKV